MIKATAPIEKSAVRLTVSLPQASAALVACGHSQVWRPRGELVSRNESQILVLDPKNWRGKSFESKDKDDKAAVTELSGTKVKVWLGRKQLSSP